MKVYLVFAKIFAKEYDTKLKYLLGERQNFSYRYKKDQDQGFYYGLYGWATNKVDLKKFLSSRNPEKVVIKKKVLEKEEWKKFKSQFKKQKIKEYDFCVDEESYPLIATWFEHYNCSSYYFENYVQFSLPSYATIDYSIFDEKIQEALDLIGYTFIHDTYNANDETIGDGRKELADYNAGFDKTPFGNPIPQEIVEKNEYALFFRLYDYFFV